MAKHKRKINPYDFTASHVIHMEVVTGLNLPHPKEVEGATLCKGRLSEYYKVDANLYYNHLIAEGYGKRLEQYGVINAETLVGNFGGVIDDSELFA